MASIYPLYGDIFQNTDCTTPIDARQTSKKMYGCVMNGAKTRFCVEAVAGGQ